MRRYLPTLTLLGACLALCALLLLPVAAGAKTTASRIAGKHGAYKSVVAPQAVAVPAQAADLIHSYTPFDIRWAYGLDKVGDPTQGTGLLGQGQTIVLVDSYGSPTAAQDLQVFHDTFYPKLPNPSFEQVFPFGRPDYKNVAKGNGLSGPAAAAGWSGEATLDIEWSYAVAPLAHIVLVAVPPAETLGVQGLPNMMKAMDKLVASEPSGTVFSQSFGIGENNFGGAAKVQAARFDQTYKAGLAKGDTFFASSGDNGTTASPVPTSARPPRHARGQLACLQPLRHGGGGDPTAARLDVGPDLGPPLPERRFLEPGLLQLGREPRRTDRGRVERVVGADGDRRRGQLDLPAAVLAGRRRRDRR